MTLSTGSDTIQELTVEELRAKVGTGMEIADAEENMLLSMGPQHPSTHGVLRLLVELAGESVSIWPQTLAFCILALKRQWNPNLTPKRW